MPTRRILTLMVTVTILMHPVMGLGRLWARKTLGTAPPGSVLHGVAEAAIIPLGVG